MYPLRSDFSLFRIYPSSPPLSPTIGMKCAATLGFNLPNPPTCVFINGKYKLSILNANRNTNDSLDASIGTSEQMESKCCSHISESRAWTEHPCLLCRMSRIHHAESSYLYSRSCGIQRAYRRTIPHGNGEPLRSQTQNRFQREKHRDSPRECAHCSSSSSSRTAFPSLRSLFRKRRLPSLLCAEIPMCHLIKAQSTSLSTTANNWCFCSACS